jgi:hypothetical protein
VLGHHNSCDPLTERSLLIEWSRNLTWQPIGSLGSIQVGSSEGRWAHAEAVGSGAHKQFSANHSRSALSSSGVGGCGRLFRDASWWVLHQGHREAEAESLCGTLGWEQGVAGGLKGPR